MIAARFQSACWVAAVGAVAACLVLAMRSPTSRETRDDDQRWAMEQLARAERGLAQLDACGCLPAPVRRAYVDVDLEAARDRLERLQRELEDLDRRVKAAMDAVQPLDVPATDELHRNDMLLRPAPRERERG